MAMRIAHVTATFPPYYAGTGNMCFHSARLSARAGYDVTVYTAGTGGEPESPEPGLCIKRLPPQLRVGNAVLLAQLLTIPRYDLVHLHYPFILGAELVWLRRVFAGQAYVVSYHNDLVWDGVKGLLFRLYQLMWTRLVLTGARRIIVSTRDFAYSSRQLRRYTQVARDRIVEVPNGVDVETLRPGLDGSELRRKLRIDDNSPVVLFVGAMDAAHDLKGGVPVLLRAIAIVGDPRTTLLLIGGGAKVSSYAALARQLGIAAQTRFVGWVPHDALGPYYAAADIAVLPSVRTEAFGMVVIEALACARAVIASDLPGLRTVVQSTQGGVLVPPGDAGALALAIRDLLTQPVKRRLLGERGRQAVERLYAWPRVTERLMDVYSDVMKHA
jgi:glycosyltransferase involved in cell wall biosynthesis